MLVEPFRHLERVEDAGAVGHRTVLELFHDGVRGLLAVLAQLLDRGVVGEAAVDPLSQLALELVLGLGGQKGVITAPRELDQHPRAG